VINDMLRIEGIIKNWLEKIPPPPLSNRANSLWGVGAEPVNVQAASLLFKSQ
jgi:hypothetical protein